MLLPIGMVLSARGNTERHQLIAGGVFIVRMRGLSRKATAVT
jgi:hypothetical protein